MVFHRDKDWIKYSIGKNNHLVMKKLMLADKEGQRQ